MASSNFEVRLKTFANWTLTYITPFQLARAGFFYTGVNDRVRCSSCSCSIDKWNLSSDPFKEHVAWDNKYLFILDVAGPAKKEETLVKRALDNGFSEEAVVRACTERRNAGSSFFSDYTELTDALNKLNDRRLMVFTDMQIMQCE